MSFGFEIKNNSGDLVVDGEFQNHVIIESGTVATPGLGINTVTFASTYAPSRQPMIFGRCTGDFVGFIDWTFSGGNINGFRYAAKAGGSSFQWKLAVTPTAASSDTFGMRIWDASGNLVFDAGLNYLNLIDAIAITTLTGGGVFNTGNTAHASGTTPFYCMSSGASYGVAQTGALRSDYFALSYKAVDATHVGQDWTSIANIAAVTGVAPRPSSPVLLVMDDTAPAAGSGFGITIWKASGSVLSSMTTKLTRFLYHTVANAGVSGSQAIASLDTARCVGFALPRGPLSIGQNAHDVTLTAGNVAWAPASVGTNVQSDIYVVQYK